MTIDADLALLEQTISGLGVDIRTERCESAGGLVRICGAYQLFLNPAAAAAERREVCIEALRHLRPDNLHLPPRVRQLLGEEM